MIAHLTWDFGHTKCFSHPLGNEFKFIERVSFNRILKVLGFLLETRSNCKITLVKTKCVVIYHGNNNGNHMCCGKRKPLYLGFLSWTVTIYMTAGEEGGGGYLFNSSLTLPPTSQKMLDISLAITTESSLQLYSNQEPLVSKCKLLTTELCGKQPLVSMKTWIFKAW